MDVQRVHGQLAMLRLAFVQLAVAGVVGQVDAALFDGNVRELLFTAIALALLVLGQDGGLELAVFVVGKFQEDKAQHRRGVFAGLQVRVGAQAVGGTPEVGFEFLELFFVHEGWTRDFEESCKAKVTLALARRALAAIKVIVISLRSWDDAGVPGAVGGAQSRSWEEGRDTIFR